MENISKYIVNNKNNIRNAIKKMDEGGIGFIAIANDYDEIIGIVTDGDFRRAVLKGINLEENVLKIANLSFKYLDNNYTKEQIKILFKSTVIQHIPILEEKKLIDIILKESFNFQASEQDNVDKLHIPAIIMAGGKGTRMDPFTKVLPKPLIPIGEKTMIELIMNEYQKYGIEDFYISVNYKAKLIKAYFEEIDKTYSIRFIDESKPLGTAGALKFLEGKIDGPFFVSNCDIIIKDNYYNIFDFHKKSNFALTVVASMQHHVVPYGVCEITEGGELKSLKEKPEFDYLVNTGMYLLNPEVLQDIPYNEFFHITDLIQTLIKKNIKVGVFPVSEKSYIDVGQWKEYKDAIKILSE